jgi:hypothetical protein
MTKEIVARRHSSSGTLERACSVDDRVAHRRSQLEFLLPLPQGLGITGGQKLFGGARHRKVEGCPTAEHALDPDLSAMGIDNPFADRQSEPGTIS